MKTAPLLKKINNCVSSIEKQPVNIFCLGCAIKVPLKKTLLPALKTLQHSASLTGVNIDLGHDAYVFNASKPVGISRNVYPSCRKNGFAASVASDIKRCGANSAVLLTSFMPPAEQSNIENAISGFYRNIPPDNKPFRIGKGHTIQISKVPSQEFILADYIISSPGDLCCAVNHDTIVTVDFNLRHCHWLNVLISFNNALNDLHALGIYKDISLFPVYDVSNKRDKNDIQESFATYINGFKRYNLRLTDCGPLNLGLECIGTSVSGFTDREPPRISGLIPEQVLIITRPIGDLSALVWYILETTRGRPAARMRELKTRVLNHMARSNIGIAEIIASYLPPRGKPFIPEKHITASKDISGEGLGALEDMALFSKVDIHLETLRLHASETAKIQVRNNTANTNGAIVIAAHRKLAPRIMRDIKKTGSTPWIAGWVGNPSRSPKIYLKRSLREYPFLRKRPYDIFNRFVFT
ncbi:MAG: hypothetical protein PHC33_02050 [Candidatus Omnitrophica bacterium]|nr:hypothetical protein [Candidatus Omnitrophota bacterium]